MRATPRGGVRLERDWRLVVLLVALAGLALRAGIALRDLDVVDRLFIPDDTYYTLSIARSLAEGLGPTADGSTLTSGFQPLVAVPMVPVFALTSDPDLPLRVLLLLLAVVDAAVVALLGLLAHRLAGPVAAILAAVLWAFSPVAIGNALNGLETSLAVMLQLALALVWWRARERDDTRLFVAAGALAGLALLARVDAAFLVVALGLLELAERRWRRLALAAGVAFVVVLPWWAWCTAQFGSPVPESGAAVQELVSIHRDIYLTTTQQLGWAAGTLLGTPFSDWDAARDRLFASPAAATAVWLALVGALAAGGWALRRRGRVVLALTAHAVAVVAFYSLVVSALWFFRRYLAPAEAVLTVGLAVVAALLLRRFGPRSLPGVLTAAAVVALTGLGVAGSLRLLTTDPPTSPDVALDGAKGYREAARDVLAGTPPGAVVGSLQSGALAYYAPRGVRVVNLDGVVDRHAARALHSGQLGAFARERGMTHFADWPFNVALFQARSGAVAVKPEQLRLIATARLQGTDAFGLYEVAWPRG